MSAAEAFTQVAALCVLLAHVQCVQYLSKQPHCVTHTEAGQLLACAQVHLLV